MKRNSAILVLVFIICSCSVLKDTVKKKFCDAPYNRDMADLLKKYPFKYGPYKIDSEGGVYKSDELIIIFEDGLTEAQKQVAASSINAMSLETCNCEGNLGRATFKDELSARLAFEGVTQVINKPTGIEGVERNYYISDDILEDNIDLNGVSDIGKASNNSTNLVRVLNRLFYWCCILQCKQLQYVATNADI